MENKWSSISVYWFDLLTSYIYILIARRNSSLNQNKCLSNSSIGFNLMVNQLATYSTTCQITRICCVMVPHLITLYLYCCNLWTKSSDNIIFTWLIQDCTSLIKVRQSIKFQSSTESSLSQPLLHMQSHTPIRNTINQIPSLKVKASISDKTVRQSFTNPLHLFHLLILHWD